MNLTSFEISYFVSATCIYLLAQKGEDKRYKTAHGNPKDKLKISGSNIYFYNFVWYCAKYSQEETHFRHCWVENIRWFLSGRVYPDQLGLGLIFLCSLSYKYIKQVHCYCYYSSIITYYLIYNSHFTSAPGNNAAVEKQFEYLRAFPPWSRGSATGSHGLLLGLL